MNVEKLANPGALKTRKYVPGKLKRDVEKELGISNMIKLASNESASGPSPMAVEAYHALAGDLHVYPDSVCRDLRAALADKYALSADEVTVGNGADGVIYNIGMAVIDQGDEVIIPKVTFPMYESISKIMRAKLIITDMDESGYRYDLQSIRDALSPRTKVVFLCSPNNPTGDAIPREDLLRLLHDIPKNVLIVLDEAYIEFIEPGWNPDSVSLLKNGMDNLFIIRTFSKMLGLAGIRVGYGMGHPDLINLIHRIKEPFNVSAVAEYVAIRALEDDKFIDETLTHVRKEKEYYYSRFEELGFTYTRSHTNFVMFDTNGDAKEIAGEFLHKGLIVRPVNGFGLPRCIRVTIGTTEENRRFFKAFEELISEKKIIPGKRSGS